MTIRKPASASSRLNEESVQRVDRDRTRGEHYENEELLEHQPKAQAPIDWDEGGSRQSGNGIAAMPADERDGGARETLVETTDLERRVLVLERILQALIAHMAETEPRFIDRLSATFTDPIRVAHEEHNYIDTASYAERFIREIVRLGERPVALKIHTPKNFQNP